MVSAGQSRASDFVVAMLQAVGAASASIALFALTLIVAQTVGHFASGVLSPTPFSPKVAEWIVYAVATPMSLGFLTGLLAIPPVLLSAPLGYWALKASGLRSMPSFVGLGTAFALALVAAGWLVHDQKGQLGLIGSVYYVIWPATMLAAPAAAYAFARTMQSFDVARGDPW